MKIIAIDILNNKSIFSCISECSIAINIDRSKNKHCLFTGEKYKKFYFLIATPPGSTKKFKKNQITKI